MAVRKVDVTEYTCDSCGKVQHAAPAEAVIGLLGDVVEVRKDGAEIRAEWYACKLPHVAKAVRAALDRAETDAQTPEEV